VTIRIIFLTGSFILAFLALALVTSIAGAQGPIDLWQVESFYLAQNFQGKAFEELTPEEKQRIIENYRKYKNLPPPERKKLKKHYKKWKKMSPQEQKNLKKRYKKKFKGEGR
jgi:hypothetical protein